MMSTATLAAPAAPNTIIVGGFFADGGFDFVARSVIGYAAQGLMDVGQVFATLARVTDGDASSWYAAWRPTADKLHAQATAALVAGHTKTAARLFIAAAESYSQAIAFADGMDDQSAIAPTFALHRQAWEAFVDASEGRVIRIAVPYEGTTMPGYLFRPDAAGTRRPTVVITNGSEGSLSAMWATGVSTALARGYNAFLYDGPGQQSMLFDKNVPFRYDWEAALTPVVDSVIDRDDVDRSALFAYGISQAGYWVARALAFEKRFVAAVLDPGVHDVAAAWLSNLPPQLVALLQSGNKDAFNAAMAEAAKDPKMALALAFRGRPFAQPTVYDTFVAAMQYNLRDVAAQITTPVLLTDPDDEQFWPHQSEELAALLTGEHSIVRFLREDGANFHVEPMGRAAIEDAMYDYFDDHLSTSN
jgi:hypothetical protein